MPGMRPGAKGISTKLRLGYNNSAVYTRSTNTFFLFFFTLSFRNCISCDGKQPHSQFLTFLKQLNKSTEEENDGCFCLPDFEKKVPTLQLQLLVSVGIKLAV